MKSRSKALLVGLITLVGSASALVAIAKPRAADPPIEHETLAEDAPCLLFERTLGDGGTESLCATDEELGFMVRHMGATGVFNLDERRTYDAISEIRERRRLKH